MKAGDQMIDGMKQLTHDSKKKACNLRELTQCIFAKPLRFVENLHPHKPKTEARVLDESDRAFLKPIIKEHPDFVLSHLAESEVDMLIDAMEKEKISSGEKIIEQGDVGDYLYVLKKGSIRYLKEGLEIGSAGPGEVFGELALLYDCPRAATVIATSKCLLYRVSRETFRMIQASFVLSNDNETRLLLKKSKMFRDLPEEIISEMATCLFKKKFKKGEILIPKGKPVNEVYFLREGRVVGKDLELEGTFFADLELKIGDSFGERAIVTETPAMGNAECLTDGMAYALTKERLSSCFQGLNLHQLVQHSMDARILRVMPFFVNSDISQIELTQMAGKLKSMQLEPGEVLATIGEEMEPALYFISTESKKPHVEMTGSDGVTKILSISEPFGFGKEALIVSHLDNTDLARYREDHHVVDLDTPDDIQKQKRSILRRNIVISQFNVKVLGTETVHLRRLVINDIKDIVYDLSRLGKIYQTNSSLDARITHETLEKRCLLGQGTFGEVWLCRDPVHDSPYALKIQYKHELIERHQACGVIRETQIMQKMHHPFVMGLLQAQQDPKCLYMMMDLVQGGELRQQMRNVDRANLSEPAAKFYAACILEGLAYMHRRKYIYRDLKGQNVLLDKDGYCVIVDLGFAKYVPDKTFTFCGTPVFIAPEVLLNQGHDKSADIWSFGVLIYEMLFGVNPFFDYDDPTVNQRKLFKRIVKAEFQRPRKQSALDAYANTSDVAKDLIKKLLVTKPSKRLGCMGQADIGIRKHPWFREVDFGMLYRKELEAPWVPEISNPFDGKNFNTVISKTKSGVRKLTAEEQKQFEEFG